MKTPSPSSLAVVLPPPPHTPQALISSFNVRNWQLKLSQWSAYNKSSEKLNELGCNYYPPPSLSLIHSIYIIVEESYSQNHLITILPRVMEEPVAWQKFTPLTVFRPTGEGGDSLHPNLLCHC